MGVFWGQSPMCLSSCSSRDHRWSLCEKRWFTRRLSVCLPYITDIHPFVYSGRRRKRCRWVSPQILQCLPSVLLCPARPGWVSLSVFMECNIALKLTLVLVLPCRSTQSMSGAQWLKPLRYFMAFGRFSSSSLHWNTETSLRRRHVESCQCLAQAMTFDKQSLSIMNAPSLGTGRWVSYPCENPSCPGKGAERPFFILLSL